MEEALSAQFMGAAWRPVQSRPLRAGGVGLEIHEIRFAQGPVLGREAFLSELRSYFGGISKLLTAEFQVTGIEASSTGLKTRVRYELIGTGDGFFREQRIGHWRIHWEHGPENSYQVVQWNMEEELRSRSAQPFFADVTRTAFGGTLVMLRRCCVGPTMADGAGWRVRHRYLWAQRRVGRRHRWGRLDTSTYANRRVFQIGSIETVAMGRLKTLPNLPASGFLRIQLVLCSRISTTMAVRIWWSCERMARCCS